MTLALRRTSFVLLLILMCLPLGARAADLPCDNPSPATQEQVTASGGTIKLGDPLCPKDLELGISSDVGAAKTYLLSIARNLRDSKAPPDKSRIDALNNSFAVCAANFLKAYSQRYGAVYVVSAFRCGPNSPSSITCNRSENAAAGGATFSNHQLGLAADVNPANGDYQTMWRFAQANPQFGVCFPYLSSDRPHMALAGTGTGEASRCASQGITKMCSGAPVFDIKSVPSGFSTQTAGDESIYVTTQAPVYQTLPQAAFGTTPQTSLTPSWANTPAQSTTQTAPQICTPSFSCASGIMYYQTSSCTTQTYQVCAYGCNGNACATSTTTSSTLGGGVSSIFSTSSNANTNTNTTTSSSTEQPAISDYLSQFTGYTATAVDIGTSSGITFQLDPETGDVIQVLSGAKKPVASSTGVISTVQPAFSQQTFTSGDLSNSGASFQGQAPTSGLSAVLSGMRSALEWALGVLRSLRP